MVMDSTTKNNFNEKGPLPIDKNKENEKREKRRESDRKGAQNRRIKKKQIDQEKRKTLKELKTKNEQLKEKINNLELIRNQLETFWVNVDSEPWPEPLDESVNSDYGVYFTQVNPSSPIMPQTIYILGEQEIITTSECKALIVFILNQSA
jgi:hypothetical protein